MRKKVHLLYHFFPIVPVSLNHIKPCIWCTRYWTGKTVLHGQRKTILHANEEMKNRYYNIKKKNIYIYIYIYNGKHYQDNSTVLHKVLTLSVFLSSNFTKRSCELFILSFSSNPNRILSLPPASGSACRRQRVFFFHPRFRICFIVPSLLYQSCCWPWSDVSPDAREVVSGGILIGVGVTTRWNRAIVHSGVSFSRLRVTVICHFGSWRRQVASHPSAWFG